MFAYFVILSFECIGIVIVTVTEAVPEKDDVEVLVEVVLEVEGDLEEVAVVGATRSRGSSQVNG
jgi:diphthamide synthase (EF-2-diphthine--ammonia ligase)